MILDMNGFEGIRRWIYRNARPLDLARWRYHFEGGARDEVLRALAAYQNADGGMGHALEADAWNPHSSPVQSSTGMAILREVGLKQSEHPVVQGLLRYLQSGADLVDGRWLNMVRSNNDYPHAPWWHTDSVSTSHSGYNPAAILAGFIVEFAEKGSALYQQGLAIAHELLAAFAQDPRLMMHPLLCVADLLEAITRVGLGAEFEADALRQRADARAQDLIRQDAHGWEGYAFRPSHYIRTPDSPLYAANRDLVSQEIDYLVTRRNAAGVWDITWRWEAYPEAFAISANWWQADLAIRNALFLDAFGRVAR